MRLSTSASILLAACFSPLFFAACGSTPGDQNANFAAASPAVQEFPFKTREPDVFQTDIVIRTGNSERRLSVARDGLKRRIDYDAGTDGHRAVITADNKQYLLFFKRRLYEERPLTTGPIPENELASHLTYTRDLADFEEVGREGSVVRFRATVNESETSDVIIFFDETIGLPIRQEFYSNGGGERSLQFSVELQNFRTSVDQSVFRVPAGFRLENQK